MYTRKCEINIHININLHAIAAVEISNIVHFKLQYTFQFATAHVNTSQAFVYFKLFYVTKL